MAKRDPIREVLKHWHGMTVAEVQRYKQKLDAGERLNAIETAEAESIVERVKSWEARQQ